MNRGGSLAVLVTVFARYNFYTMALLFLPEYTLDPRC